MKRDAFHPTAYWHTTPLHYVPHLLATGTLWAQSRFAPLSLPLLPRPTVWRRDRKLRLDGYVHLSLASITPLLRDKCEKGYPHVLLEFSTDIARLPGACLMPYNAKSWRHRDDFAPVTDEIEKAQLLEAWRAGRYPSLELLVADALPLTPHAVALHTATEGEAALIQHLRASLPDISSATQALPVLITPTVFPPGVKGEVSQCAAYFNACESAGVVLSPPPLPFD